VVAAALYDTIVVYEHSQLSPNVIQLSTGLHLADRLSRRPHDPSPTVEELVFCLSILLLHLLSK
jgi:hypothetical protein